MITIKPHNEVYVKVHCSEAWMSQELDDAFSFRIPNAQFDPRVKNKLWDGYIHLFHQWNKTLYKGLVHKVEDFAKARDIPVEIEFDNSSINFSLKEANEWLSNQKFGDLTPDKWQTDAFVHCVRNNRGLLESPTSSGKSLIINMLMRYYNLPTLIIVPTTTLIHQLHSDFFSYGFDSTKYVQKIYAGQSQSITRPVVISTWQSIYKNKRSWFDSFNVVIGDEAHQFKAKSLVGIMEKTDNIKHRFGLTGSLDKSLTNKMVLEGLFGVHKRVVTTKELQEAGRISELKIKSIVLKYTDEERKPKRDYKDEIDFLVAHPKRNKFIKNLSLSVKGNTLILFQFIRHGQELYDIIKQEAGDRHVFFIHGNVDSVERDEVRAIVEKEKNAIIVASYGTFSTGINIRNLHNLIFASPSKSIVRVLQSIGRVLRKADAKEHATLFDISDDLSWKRRRNFGLKHLMERTAIYNNEKFLYKIYKVKL